jgi:outer membrane autotransporter protein
LRLAQAAGVSSTIRLIGKSLNPGRTEAIGESDYISNGASRRFRQDVGGFQVGVDRRFHVSGGNLYLDVFGGYLYGSDNFYDRAGASSNGLSLGAYATFIRPEGWCADLVFKLFQAKINSRSAAGLA